MATNLDSGTVASGDDATPAQYNNLRKDVIRNAGDYEVAGGTGDVITLSIDAQYVAYAGGDKIRFQASAVNTGAVTINVNSLGAKTVLKHNDQALEAGDIENGQEIELIYDGTNFQMISPSGNFISSADKETLTDGSDAASLHSHSNSSSLISFNSSQSTVNSTAAETSIKSVIIPANTLGTGSGLRFSLYVSSFTMDASNNAKFIVKYGSTDVATFTLTENVGAPIASLQGVIEGTIFATGATNTQQGVIRTLLLINQATGNQNFAQDAVNGNAFGTSTEDSTGDLTLDIRIDFNNSSASNLITVENLIVESIQL